MRGMDTIVSGLWLPPLIGYDFGALLTMPISLFRLSYTALVF
jgi:hypothetical protein